MGSKNKVALAVELSILNDKARLNSNLQGIIQGCVFTKFAALVDIAQALWLNLAHTDAATALQLVCDWS